MDIDGTTLFLLFWSPTFCAGPQKPQTLTASKIEYEKFLTKNLNFLLKYRYFGVPIIQECEFTYDHYKCRFKTPKNFEFQNLI